MSAVERAKRALDRIVNDGVHADPDNPEVFIAFPDDVAALRDLIAEYEHLRANSPPITRDQSGVQKGGYA